MDKDSIREFLEKRHKELVEEEYFPKIKKDRKEIVEDKGVKKPKLKKFFLSSFSLLLIFGLLYFSKEVYERWKIADMNKNENVFKKVSQLVDIPKGETPTIVTVTNSESLKSQFFFKDAQIGDKVIVFEISKKAILYRPKTKKIISVSPIN